MTDVTVVLVHGAFAESASWTGVITALQSREVKTIATPNQLRSVSTDAENVRRAVESLGGPVLLVGHSYGGAVITEAAVGSDTVKGLVYVAAFAPEHGETSLGLSSRFPGSTLGETIRPIPLGDDTNDLIIDRDLFPAQFAHDVPLADATIAAATQRAVRDVALGEPQPAEVSAWKTLPSWFVFGTGDKNIPVEAQRFMAQRAGSLKTLEIHGASHSVLVSHPEAVADVIVDALAHLS